MVGKQPVTPLCEPETLDPGRIALGKKLFHDKRFSRDNSVSCASCHDMNKGGADGLPTAIGIDGQRGAVNTPTVFNSSLSLAQFWDGRARTLEEQVPGPIHSPSEMGSNWQQVIGKLTQDAALVDQFKDVYGAPISEKLIVDAIASYEHSLITTGASFDKYLLGDETAIPDAVREGYELFREVGCISCHQGRAVGGNMFQKFGVMEDFSKVAELGNSDNGRFNVTERPADLHRFKVPSLRNVTLTAPYFHDGRTASLEDAIRIMAKHQLGTELTAKEVTLIEQFLGSLTGTVRSDWQ